MANNFSGLGYFSSFYKPAKSESRAMGDSYVIIDKGKERKDDSLNDKIIRNLKK